MRDLTGKTFGRLRVLGKSAKAGRARWFCSCSCGNFPTVLECNLLSEASRSCGCTVRRHGHYGSPTYTVWKGMKQRCGDPGHGDYEQYGGRGIKVCERWLKFENFLADMGERPKGMTLDRKDTNGDYERDNCCWATNSRQQQNKRNNRMLTLFGETLPLVVWRDRFHLKTHTLWNWLRAGWTGERIEAELKNL